MKYKYDSDFDHLKAQIWEFGPARRFWDSLKTLRSLCIPIYMTALDPYMGPKNCSGLTLNLLGHPGKS